ncbi:hypothetical protein [Chitinimonas sp.]|uniref:hypothetical protein n=1 Tax=Chitinimonas sp. TaxID=1934313 RepID=UPI0035B2FC31
MKAFLIGLFATLVSLSTLAASPTPPTCIAIDSNTDFLARATGGGMSLRGNSCTTLDASGQLSSWNWNGTLTFNNYAPSNAGGFTANGALTFALSQDLRNGTLTGSYNGPVSYSYRGATYNVVFNNLVVNLASSGGNITPTSTSGTVSVNGVTYPAGTWIWAYLF